MYTVHKDTMKRAKKAAGGSQNISPWGPAKGSFGKRGSRWRARAAPTPSCSAKRHDGQELLPMLPTGTFPATAISCRRSERLRSLRSLWRLRRRSPACRRSKLPAESARATLRAVGTGYLKFALAETGLFRTAFSVPDLVEDDVDAAKAGKSGLNPFQLLSRSSRPDGRGGCPSTGTEARGGVSRLVCRSRSGFPDHRGSL